MPYLERDGGFRLYYERRGRGPAVLFAHGAGGNALSWWQQLPAFAERYTAITFDHRAFGRSPDVAGGPGRSAFAEDAQALLDHLGVERAHVVAHSMGGRTALGLLRRAPHRVGSLVFSGTVAGCVDAPVRARRAELAQAGVFAGSLLARALADDFAAREPALALLYHQVRSINPPRPRDFLSRPMGAGQAGDRTGVPGSTAGRLRAWGRPLLWVVGERDRVVPAELVRMAHALTPGSRYAEVADAGHSAYFEQAAAWNTAVRAFIDGVEAGAA